MQHKNISGTLVTRIWPWGLVLALSACGGGGGGDTAVAPPPPVTPPVPVTPVTPTPPPVVNGAQPVGIQAENDQYRIVYTATDSADSRANSAQLEWVQNPGLESQLATSTNYSMTLDEAPLIAPYSGTPNP